MPRILMKHARIIFGYMVCPHCKAPIDTGATDDNLNEPFGGFGTKDALHDSDICTAFDAELNTHVRNIEAGIETANQASEWAEPYRQMP